MGHLKLPPELTLHQRGAAGPDRKIVAAGVGRRTVVVVVEVPYLQQGEHLLEQRRVWMRDPCCRFLGFDREVFLAGER